MTLMPRSPSLLAVSPDCLVSVFSVIVTAFLSEESFLYLVLIASVWNPFKAIQFTGQLATHIPQPWQTLSITWLLKLPSLCSCFSGAPKGQTSMHFQQDTHRV